MRRKPTTIHVHTIEYHRNGVGGEGFHVVLFTSMAEPIDEDRRMVATVFEEPGRVSILDVDLLVQGNVKFGENSWRCESFEDELRAAIEDHAARPGPFSVTCVPWGSG